MPQQSANTNEPVGRYRWGVCALLFFAIVLVYLDRLALSILKKPLSEEFGWSDADYGYIQGAFSIAYAFGYLLGGRFLDRVGVKRGLPLVVLGFSLTTAAHGLIGLVDADDTLRFHYPWFSSAEGGFALLSLMLPTSAAGFALARIAMGLTQGGSFPGSIKAIAEWFPVSDRALATGWFNTGSNVGAIACPIFIPALLPLIGWEATFFLAGGLGVAWVIAWWMFYDAPEDHPSVTPAELDYIMEGRPAVEQSPRRVPLLSLLGYRAVWAYIAASILAAPAWGVYQSFIPDFLDKKFTLSLQAIGWWTAAFFAVALFGGIIGGWLAGRLMEKGWTVNAARKIALLLCALAVAPVFLAPYVNEVWTAVLILGIAGSAHQGWSANMFSVVSDTMPREAISSVVGLGGFLAYFTGGFVNGITGKILESTGGSHLGYVGVFAYISGMYLLSLLLLQLLVPRLGSAD